MVLAMKAERRMRVMAASLAALAGFVDAVGFRASGGFFVSFMSGNSTRMGVDIGAAAVTGAIAAGLIAAFVTGSAVGEAVGHAAGRRRTGVVLALAAVLLACAAGGSDVGWVAGSLGVAAVAMGVANNALVEQGSATLPVTYMTGSLVKLGQGLAVALRGGGRLGWLFHLLQWLSFLAGVIGGALAFPVVGLGAMWAAAGAAAILASLTREV